MDNHQKLIPIFPLEVWAMILGWLEDSQDILNAFRAFPALEPVMRSSRRFWMCDQAVPHLASWLSKEELLSLRQVCKPWNRAVDNFLDNHPKQRPCSPGNLLTGQLWTPEAAPQPCRFQLPVAERTLHDRNDVRELEDHFDGHPPERNPFVGRSLKIGFGADGLGRISQHELKDYIGKIKELLRKYGRQVWFISVEDWNGSFDGIFEVFWGIVEDLLQLLPNLKGLSVMSENGDVNPTREKKEEEQEEVPWSQFSDGDILEDWRWSKAYEKKHEIAQKVLNDAAATRKFLNVQSPKWKSDMLPHLETLQFQLDFHRLPLGNSGTISTLISTFFFQIRRLEIPLLFWEEVYTQMFPELLELDLVIDEKGTSTYDDDEDPDAPRPEEEIAHLFLALNAPKLTTLILTKQMSLISEADLVGWLKRFPQIQNLVLNPWMSYHPREHWEWEDIPPPLLCQPASTLTSLHFCYCFVLNYDLLLHFPFLEYLRITFLPESSHNRGELERCAEPTIKLREFIQNGNMYGSNVWELLPKLRTVTLAEFGEGDEDLTSTHFTRAMYEHLRREANPE